MRRAVAAGWIKRNWIRRRARNVYRRPLLVGGVGAAVFVITLLGLAVIPRRARRAVGEAIAAPAQRPDTALLRRRLERAAARERAAESALARVRARVAAQSVPDFLSPERLARRDSLAAASANLALLLKRAEEAPLPASYRELGSAPELRGASRVAQLLDTLADVEQSRAEFGAAGGVDPIFVALTARATQLGRSIQEIARARRAVIQRELSTLAPPEPPVNELRAATIALDSARDSAARAREELDEAHALHRALAEQAARARVAEALAASVPAMLPGALVVGLAAGLAVAFTLEVRRPRVADVAEAQAVGGAPVIVTITEQSQVQPRRRRSDREVPPLIDLSSDEYRLLYNALADAGYNLPRVTVVGDSPLVTAAVAANLAATVARQARTTLLVDADFQSNAVAEVTRLRPEQGLADVLADRAEWAEVVRSIVVGRSRVMDVLTGGSFGASGAPEELDERLLRTLERLARRYECVVVSAPLAEGELVPPAAGAGTGPVIVCARIARTPVDTLELIMRTLAARGADVKGVVAWNREEPVVGAPVAGG
jgi:Mrp family chromosome partitioning ATPase